MAIRIDVCPYTIVIHCDDCGHWTRSAWTKEEAHDTAASHESRVHPEDMHARKARKEFRRRRGMIVDYEASLSEL